MTPLQELLRSSFPFEPTPGQELLMERISRFIMEEDAGSIFILKGYAGTGKTTFVQSLTQSLPSLNMHTVLLAPTGRAAKVLSAYSGKSAHTIHRFIYRKKMDQESLHFSLQRNQHSNTLFIVDEASMIPGKGNENNPFFQTEGNLLDDFLAYVSNGDNCRILFIGDTAQLPPVGSSLSPALDIKELEARGYRTEMMELTDVVRQDHASGILYHATQIREAIRMDLAAYPDWQLDGFEDIRNIHGRELGDLLHETGNTYGADENIIICRSNKQANRYNAYIRSHLLWREEELSAGDLLMIVKNNYNWLRDDAEAGFIANGDIAEIVRIRSYEERYGFRFANVSIRLVAYPNEEAFDCKVMLDTLNAEGPDISYEDQKKLFQTVIEDYSEYKSRRKQLEMMKQNPYYNALHVKFAYAVTCHKAQGGQWKSVFIDQGYRKDDEKADIEYLRWLYTALTRASEKLHLIGFIKEDVF